MAICNPVLARPATLAGRAPTNRRCYLVILMIRSMPSVVWLRPS
jgi:hypothetical protein